MTLIQIQVRSPPLPRTLPPPRDPQLLQQLCTHDPGDPGPGSRACLISLLPHIFRSNKAKHSTGGGGGGFHASMRLDTVFLLPGRPRSSLSEPSLPPPFALIQPSAPFHKDPAPSLSNSSLVFCFGFAARQSPIPLNLSPGRLRPSPTL